MAVSPAFVVWDSVRLRRFAAPGARAGPPAVAAPSEAVGTERRLTTTTGTP